MTLPLKCQPTASRLLVVKKQTIFRNLCKEIPSNLWMDAESHRSKCSIAHFALYLTMLISNP